MKEQEICNDESDHDEVIIINGTFREKDTGEIIKNDVFEAHKLGKLSVEEIYKVYLAWFNYTKTPYELEREFVSAKLVRVKER